MTEHSGHPSLDREATKQAIFKVLLSKLRPASRQDDETARLVVSDTAAEITTALATSLDRGEPTDDA